MNPFVVVDCGSSGRETLLESESVPAMRRDGLHRCARHQARTLRRGGWRDDLPGRDRPDTYRDVFKPSRCEVPQEGEIKRVGSGTSRSRSTRGSSRPRTRDLVELVKAKAVRQATRTTGSRRCPCLLLRSVTGRKTSPSWRQHFVAASCERRPAAGSAGVAGRDARAHARPVWPGNVRESATRS